MSRSRVLRALTALLLVFPAVLLAPVTAHVANGAAPTPSLLPGPAPACVPEVEPNDRPEDAPVMSGDVCLTGTLPDLRDQDLVLWDVQPVEALITWRITVVGIPTTITSIHIFDIRSEPGVFPIDAREFMRVDSDATSNVPGVQTGVSLKAGRYLLGVSRGDPAKGPPAPPDGYRVTIEREQSLPPSGDIEPNDDVTKATAVGDPIALVGDAEGSVDTYRWTIPPTETATRHQLDVRALPGESLSLQLLDAAGGSLARTDLTRDGVARLYDLLLPAGDYLIAITSTGSGSMPYVLSSMVSQDAAADPEPNDSASLAVPIAIGDTRSGRLTGPRDFDDYHLVMPEAVAATQTDIALRVGTQQDRRLCVRPPNGPDVQCRQGRQDLVLSNLSLAAGVYTIEVSGAEDPADHYQLAVTDVGLASTDREIEPNDSTATASMFDPTVVMRGRSANGDVDYYRLVTTGTPQVWRLDAAGTGIRYLRWMLPDGTVQAEADVSTDAASASLWDMYLTPGQHWLQVEATGEAYTLTMTPLGPLAAGTEREPNNDTIDAEPLAVGEHIVGRLPGPADEDWYRFSLEASEHVLIHVEPPADGGVRMRLTAAGTELLRIREPVPGQPVTWDMQLPTGDYELMLSSDARSIQPYGLVVERADPYVLPADLEPNGTQDVARDMPATLTVDGAGWGASGEDDDWFRLPAPPDATTPLVVTTMAAVTRLDLTDGTHSIPIDRGADKLTWTTRTPPPAAPLFLHVMSSGDYQVTVSGAGYLAAAPPGSLPLTLALSTATSRVAAYEAFGQRVAGTLTVSNTGTTPLDLQLDGRTSDDRWSVALDQTRLSVPAGGAIDVGVSIGAPADARADIATRMTLRALAPDGRVQTAGADITPGRDASPVGAEQAWPVPAALLGGLDAASLALGATVMPVGNPTAEAQLHDGYAVAGAGYTGSISGQPTTFTVELAGDTPVPVQGLIVDPLAGSPVYAASPRAFDLALSPDGTAYTVVLSGELSPRQEDQSFVLDQPIMARFAQLRIASTWTGERGSLQVGEWQVIATPGWAPPGPIDIADPATGGHVVYSDPGASDPRQLDAMLTNDVEPNPWQPTLQPDTSMSWVVGFRDGRAAQVTELQWVDLPHSDPIQRFDSLDVQVSTGTPLGPWQDAGTWPLVRAADGSVSPFDFGAPTWARYIRFVAAGPTGQRAVRETPATLRVMERPTDDRYRSILGAWGRDQSQAIMESLQPPDLSAATISAPVADGNDTSDTATQLTVDVPQDAAIQRGKDVDWYSLTIPAGQNALDLAIAAPAAAGLVPTLHDSTGAVVPLTDGISSDPTVAHYLADVDPGATYHVLVEQPPFSVVFTYDTSGSMGPFLSYISEALRSFAAGVRPGEEAVQIAPFEDPPLLQDWTDDAYQIEDAVAGVFSVSGSSASETAMLGAMQQLEARPGARAILMVTDAETSSFYRMGDLWPSLAKVKPLVFAVHVGGGGAPGLTVRMMEDWAHSWGGNYEYAASHGQIDRAFDRLATWMRRPTTYTIGYGATFVDHSPGQLTISPPPGPDGDQSVVAGSGVGVEIVLDTSGSMNRKVGKLRRIEIARSVLKDLVSRTLPTSLPVALRIFDAHKKCGSVLVAPMAPLDRARMTTLVGGIKISLGTKTPLAATLETVAGDLGHSPGPKIIVLVTDGQESCQGDPEQAIRDLVAAGLDVRVNIVGFAIDDAGLKEQLQHWAEVGNGRAFDAQGSADLAAGIATALRAPFQVYDKDDQLVASGVVGGEPVQLPPGTYRVEVLTDPILVFQQVVIAAGASRDIQLEAPAPAAIAPRPQVTR